MRPTSILATLALAFTLGLSACSDSHLVVHGRDTGFYDRFVNKSSEFRSASSKLESLKLVYNESDYPMRLALFENGKLYYQIDELGDGYGVWSHQDGMLKIWASRPRFEMKMGLSGLKETGEATALRFFDRHGLNTIEMRLRDPAAAAEKLPALRPFTHSDQNI